MTAWQVKRNPDGEWWILCPEWEETGDAPCGPYTTRREAEQDARGIAQTMRGMDTAPRHHAAQQDARRELQRVLFGLEDDDDAADQTAAELEARGIREGRLS